MRALRIEKFDERAGGVHLREIDAPQPGPGDVLVQIRCAGLNPSDARNAQGRMPQTTLPRTSGRDFAGTAAGSGEEVFGSGGDVGFTRDGTHAELIALPREALVPRPAALSRERAAACGVPYVTAYDAIISKAELRPGETLLVVGGGAVGHAAAQLARWCGARAVLATRREPHGVQLGAFESAHKLDDVPAASVQVVLNTVGGASFEPSTRALAKHGRMSCIAADFARKEVNFDLFSFYRRELTFFGVDSLALTCIDAARMLDRMLPGFAAGTLMPPEPERVSLDEGPAVMAQVLAGNTHKRVFVP